MTRLSVEIEGNGQLEELASRIEQSLSALEQLPKFPLESFLRLGDAIAHQLSVEPLCPASGTGDDRIALRVSGHIELFAAAVGALERYLCHEVTPSRG